MSTPITTGTVTVIPGSAIVTGSGTNWTLGVRAGDSFELDRDAPAIYIIESVDSNAQITLHQPYTGDSLESPTTNSDLTYKIYRVGDLARDFLSMRESLYNLAVELENGSVFRPDVVGPFSDRVLYDDEYLNKDGKPFIFAAITDPDGSTRATWRFYAKKSAASADWSLGHVPEGPTGGIGPAGFTPGRKWMFSTSVVDGNPGSGNLRFNSATFASITKAWVSNTDGEGISGSTWLDTFDTSTNTIKGTLWIYLEGDSTVFRIFEVTGSVVDRTNFREISLTPIQSNGTILDTAEVILFFSYAGNAGPTGDPGTSGEDGYDGIDGFQTGIRMYFSDDTSAVAADPGDGYFRFNDPVFSAITTIFFDNVDVNLVSIATEIDTWDDSTTEDRKATIRFEKAGDPDVYATFLITAAHTSAATYKSITVTPLVKAGTWTNDDLFVVNVSLVGDAGSTAIVSSVNSITPDENGNVVTPVGVIAITYLTSGTNATFTPDTDTRAMLVECIGGGGGGGGVDGQGATTGGCGGAGGGGEKAVLFITDMDQTFKYTIGAGGTGATAGNNAGSAGGSTTFFDGDGTNPACVANGGSGGAGVVATSSIWGSVGGDGGTGGTGDAVFAGQNGGPARGNGTAFYSLGLSGAAPGMGGGNKVTTNITDGNPGTAYGEGGTGGLSSGVGTNYAGGNGYQGVIRVTEFY